jgi:amino acid adenylation domain-containing protein
MNALEVLAKARAAGVRISADGDRLKLRAAKGAITPELAESIKANKADLLMLLSKGSGPAQTVAIPVADRNATIAPAFAQQGLWFLDELDPGSSVYNMGYRLTLKGALDKKRLKVAINKLVARHEALRTVFQRKDGQLAQVIQPELEVSLETVDCTGAQAERDVREQAFITRHLDLATGPLIRAGLVELEPDQHELLLCVHHIVFDIWSGQLFFEQLAELYAADDPAFELPAPALQFADYAAWQAGLLDAAERERLLAYWRKHLAGAPPAIELPFDFKRPLEPTHRGAWVARRLSPDLLPRLNAVAGKESATLFMLMFAAFAVLLARYTNEKDVVIGTSVDGRNHQDLEGVIGFFLNTIAVRSRLDSDPSFSELLNQVRTNLLNGFAHQELPFDMLVDDLKPDRDLSRNPIVQVTLDWQQESGEDLEIEGLNVQGPDFISQQSAKFDLTLTARVDGSELEIGFEYSTDLFKAATIERMIDSLDCLLEDIATDPAKPVNQLNIVSDADRNWLLNTINATDVPLEPVCLHTLVERRAADMSAAIAMEWQDQKLSYRDINEYTNRLARALIEAGLGPRQTACVLVDRGLHFPLALLAIVKAGGAYVPIAPDIPAERLAYMLDNADAQLVITTAAHTALVDADQTTIFRVDEFDYRKGDGSNLDLDIDPLDPAYVIYTSGSTGRPKGVTLTHLGLVNLVRWQSKQPGLDHAARTIHYASLSFDVSFTETFTTWDAGGTLVVIEEELRRDFPALLDFIDANQIERVFLPCAALDPFAHAVNQRNQGVGFTDVIVSGEQLQITPSIRQMFIKHADVRLHNHYGPAETHVVTALTLTSDAAGWDTMATIGVPIDNTQLYVVDEHMQLVPKGATGELYLGGVCVGLGYHNNPEQTAERFLPDPFRPDQGTQLYRTGDSVRFRADGEMEFLGRIDTQIKLRGYRIEPGEIESVLAEHETVQLAAVIMTGVTDEAANRMLVAYIVCAEDQDFSADALRNWAHRFLPDYMVPTLFIKLDAMPLTPTGKLDRRRLPAPDSIAQVEYAAPSTPTEIELVKIYAAVLGDAPIGINDDFFRRGGNSLLAMQLVGKIRETFDVNLPLKNAFRYPQAKSLATVIDALKGTAASQDTAGDQEQFVI